MSDSNENSLERLREQVIEQLSAGYSRDFLSQSEFEERIETATDARTHADLRRLIVDLPTVGSPNAPATTGSGELYSPESEFGYVVNRGEVPESSSMIAVFSASERKGMWIPPRHLHAVAVFGACEIDLRDAQIPPGGLTINAFAMMGAVEVLVPDGVRIETHGGGIFGAFEGNDQSGTFDSRAPVVRVEGAAFFGAVEAKHKKKKRKR
ncbi:MAG: DUF1707 domain-containing protein [Spirochaetales bacterium]